MAAEIVRLREELWERLSRHIPEQKGRGRRAKRNRDCFEAIVYQLRNGGHWSELPACYPPKSTVHLRLTTWAKRGIFEALWQELLTEYDDLVGLGWEWLSADAVLTKAPLGGEKNGAESYGPRKRRHQASCFDGRAGNSHCLARHSGQR